MGDEPVDYDTRPESAVTANYGPTDWHCKATAPVLASPVQQAVMSLTRKAPQAIRSTERTRGQKCTTGDVSIGTWLAKFTGGKT
jgi:hypothetical protein